MLTIIVSATAFPVAIMMLFFVYPLHLSCGKNCGCLDLVARHMIPASSSNPSLPRHPVFATAPLILQPLFVGFA